VFQNLNFLYEATFVFRIVASVTRQQVIRRVVFLGILKLPSDDCDIVTFNQRLLEFLLGTSVLSLEKSGRQTFSGLVVCKGILTWANFPAKVLPVRTPHIVGLRSWGRLLPPWGQLRGSVGPLHTRLQVGVVLSKTS